MFQMLERFDQIEKEGNWGTKAFLKIVNEQVRLFHKWRMDIQILGPSNKVGDSDYVIGNIKIHPVDGLYYVSYKSAETENLEPAWSLKVDSDGNYYDPQDTTPQSFEEGVQQLIDPKSTPDKPRFRVQLIKASLTEGPFLLPDQDVFRGTLVNRDIHVGVIKINLGPDIT